MINPKIIIPVLMLIAIISFGTTFFINTNGAVDSGVNMTGSDYEAQYNATQDAARQPISLLIYVPLLVIAGLIIKAVSSIGD